MSDKRKIAYDPVTGMETNFIWNGDEEGTFTIQEKQDVSGIVEANKSAYANVDNKANWKGDWHHVASIPLTVYYDLKQQGILDDKLALKRWLNDPDNKYFRVRPGRI